MATSRTPPAHVNPHSFRTAHSVFVYNGLPLRPPRTRHTSCGAQCIDDPAHSCRKCRNMLETLPALTV